MEAIVASLLNPAGLILVATSVTLLFVSSGRILGARKHKEQERIIRAENARLHDLLATQTAVSARLTLEFETRLKQQLEVVANLRQNIARLMLAPERKMERELRILQIARQTFDERHCSLSHLFEKALQEAAQVVEQEEAGMRTTVVVIRKVTGWLRFPWFLRNIDTPEIAAASGCPPQRLEQTPATRHPCIIMLIIYIRDPQSTLAVDATCFTLRSRGRRFGRIPPMP